MRAARLCTALVAILILLVGCGGRSPGAQAGRVTAQPLLRTAVPTASVSTPLPAGGLTDEQVATLSSLVLVDDYPLYTMTYYGPYREGESPSSPGQAVEGGFLAPRWGCSLFAALGGEMLYGRNFDWDFSPCVLLFTDPADGYASASMVDIAYLGFDPPQVLALTDLPLTEREALLYAPYLPFDGMNEQGLAVGMAAVPSGPMRADPGKPTIDSLMVIREVLDHAGDVDQAVVLFQRYNIDWGNGPAVHYLVADRSGRSALIEVHSGEMVVIYSEEPWQMATNFLLAPLSGSAAGNCWRYDRIEQILSGARGRLGMEEAMGLLASVAQEGTQWSIIYSISTGDIGVVMGQDYVQAHAFRLGLAGK